MPSSLRLMLATALLTACVSCVDAAAQMDMSVTPAVAEVVCASGGSAQFTFTLSTNIAEAIQCSVSAIPMDVDANGVPSPSNKDGLADASPCLRFTPTDFDMPKGKSTKAVTVRITLPRAAAGGRYAIVTFSAVPKAHKSGGNSAELGVTPEIRTIVMVIPKGAASAPEPKPVAVSILSGREYPAATRGVWSADAMIRNPGNYHISLDGKITIKSISRRLIDSTTLHGGSGLVFPQRERVFRGVGRKALPDGSYEASIGVAPHGTVRFSNKSVFFTVTNGTVVITGTQRPASSG